MLRCNRRGSPKSLPGHFRPTFGLLCQSACSALLQKRTSHQSLATARCRHIRHDAARIELTIFSRRETPSRDRNRPVAVVPGWGVRAPRRHPPGRQLEARREHLLSAEGAQGGYASQVIDGLNDAKGQHPTSRMEQGSHDEDRCAR